MNEKEIISKYMSRLGKRARELHPYPKEHYQRMQTLSIEAKKKLRIDHK